MKKVFVYLYYHNLKDDLSSLDQVDYINLSFGLIKEMNGKYLLDITNVKDAIAKIKAKVKDAKIVLSIGGWGASGFSEALSNEDLRRAFVLSIVDVVKSYDLKGVDLDWEYPTVTNQFIKGRIEDRHNYSLLLKELKAKLTALDQKLILSAAVPCKTQYYEVSEVNKYLDYLHIMSYDLDYGCKFASHLGAPRNSKYTLSSSQQGLMNWVAAGFDVHKIVLGCAFYVRFSKVVSATNHGLGEEIQSFETLSYKDFTKLNVPTYLDEEALAPYGFKDGKFYSFDGILGIKAKCALVQEQGAAGIMCWEYNQDDEEHHLLKTMLEIKR